MFLIVLAIVENKIKILHNGKIKFVENISLGHRIILEVVEVG